MNPALRTVAAFLFALMLPVQGLASACAQICAQVQQAQHESRMQEMAASMSSEAQDQASEGHCSGPEMGAGKCCKAHSFMIDSPAPALAAVVPAQERESYVACWANFIPEEPSPPPIASIPFA